MDDCKKQLMDQCRRLANDLTYPPTVTNDGIDAEGHWDEELQGYFDEYGDEFDAYPKTGSQFMDEALDINYIMSSDGSFLGAEVTMTTGGPHVYIDTRFNRVVGIWGRDRVDFGYTDNVGLDDYLEEIFQALKESK